jgi:hypothetical protein
MSCETSEGVGKPYGLERVCRVLEFPRSTIYAQQARESAKVLALHPLRRGPKPKMADADLLAAIRADLDASPFAGEGHRTVWARLRILRDIRVSRARVLRLMRENALLSPHRRPQGLPTCTTDRLPPIARTTCGAPMVSNRSSFSLPLSRYGNRTAYPGRSSVAVAHGAIDIGYRMKDQIEP